MDARQRRSQERLYAAIVDLAERTPVDALSVTTVAETARVHRSTFYEHAASPGELLRAALSAELDEIRARHLGEPGLDLEEALRRTTYGVAEHLRTHAAAYRRGLAPDAGSGSLVTMLAEHFLASSRMLRDDGRLRLDLSVARLADHVTVDAALAFVAFGTVGAARAWLEDGRRRDPSTFLALDQTLLPAWWSAPAGPS